MLCEFGHETNVVIELRDTDGQVLFHGTPAQDVLEQLLNDFLEGACPVCTYQKPITQ